MYAIRSYYAVIIANYNNAPFLDEAIWSVRKQTYEALEIIVCDDASSDDSRAIIMRHAKEDHRIVPLFNERNTGVSATRHKAILNAVITSYSIHYTKLYEYRQKL